MADTVDRATRSRIMRAIRSKDTRPELALRRALWAKGLRGWRKNRRGLPGTPDVAFGRLRLAVFVDSAFWHGRGAVPDSEAWRAKLERNRERDREADRRLLALGWFPLRLDADEVLRDPAGAAERVTDALAELAALGPVPKGTRAPRRVLQAIPRLSTESTGPARGGGKP